MVSTMSKGGAPKRKVPMPKAPNLKGSLKPVAMGGATPAGRGAASTKAGARSVIRKQTRRAVRSGMPVKPSKKGLGITKNEGTPKVRKAIKTLGYNKAEKVTQRTKKRVVAREAGKIGAAMKPRPATRGFKPGR